MFAKYNITTFCAPPTMYRMLIKQDLSHYDLSSIKHASTAGEALNPVPGVIEPVVPDLRRLGLVPVVPGEKPRQHVALVRPDADLAVFTGSHRRRAGRDTGTGGQGQHRPGQGHRGD